jgi:hypothetical protein
VVERDLELEADAVLNGAVLVGGRIRIREQARLIGCRTAVVEALAAPSLEPPFPVRGGRFLGRF